MPLSGISVARLLILGLLSSQSILELNPSLSASTNKAIPSQSSSTLLFGNSVAPGKIIGLLSSQSTSLVNPSPSLSTATTVSQFTVIEPFWNVGVTICPSLSTTSIAMGVFEKLMTALLMDSLLASKQTWKISWSSVIVTPAREASSQPTLKIPWVVALKLLAVKPGIPNDCIVAAPKVAASQLIEYWKDKMSLKPFTRTSAHSCILQSAVIVFNSKLRFSSLVLSLLSSLLSSPSSLLPESSQLTVKLPLINDGLILLL